MSNQENKQGAEFNRLTVLNFRVLDANSLHMIAQDLGLAMTPAALAYIQHYYRTREGRDATVGELRFLDALARQNHNDPLAIGVEDLSANEGMMRIWRDVLRQQQALPERKTRTASELMEILPRYLARAGIVAKEHSLFSGTPAELALHCHGKPPRLMLELANSGAVLSSDSIPIAKPQRAALLLLTPRAGYPLENEIATLLSLPLAPYLSPLAVLNAEGLIPHLLELNGVMLDTAAIPGFCADNGPAALLKIGKGSLLLAAPEQAIVALFQTGLSLSLIGTTLPTGRLQLRHATENTLSLELQLLRSLQGTRSISPTLQESPGAPTRASFAETADALLGGVEITADAEPALLSLVTEAVRRGAVLQNASLSLLLSLPQGGDCALTAALPLLLGLHRAAAELTLPAANQRVILCEDATPHLSVFLAAPKGTPHEIEAPKDFAEARILFYGV